MGNCLSGGLGCIGEEAEFEPFRLTGGVVRVLIVCLNYSNTRLPLEAILDGDNMKRICDLAEVQDVTIMRDDLAIDNPLFPNVKNIRRSMADIGKRCKANDYFVWFYAGHGENVPDAPPEDENDGFDQAFVLPEQRSGKADFKDHSAWLIDDLFALTVDESIPKECRVLAINDCCHSGTICDIDTYSWKHRVIAIGACQDDQESIDTDGGGALSLCLSKAMEQLSWERGAKEYSIKSIYDKAVAYLPKIHPRAAEIQQMSLQYANCDPEYTPWPMPHPWWKK